MEDELGHFDLESMEAVHSESWVFDANWKLVMENWEVYHHVWVHQGVFDLMSDEVDFETGKPCTDMIASNNSLMLRPNDLRKESARPNPIDLPLMPWKPEIPNFSRGLCSSDLLLGLKIDFCSMSCQTRF